MKLKRVKNKILRRSYHDKTCILCKNPATHAHIKSRGSCGDYVETNIAALCGQHHTEHGSIGMTTFANKHGVFKMWLIDNGWIYNDFMGKWRAK